MISALSRLWRRRPLRTLSTWGSEAVGTEHYVDGSFFEFPSGWEVHKVDEWPEQKVLTSKPFEAKACDLVAYDGSEVWFVEVKDYTYEMVSPPRDLASAVGLKIFHTLAMMEAVALWGVDSTRRDFCRRVLAARSASACLAIELRHGGKKLFGIETQLMTWYESLRKVTKKMNIHHPVVSNSYQMGGAPWTIRRDPDRRQLHSDL